MKGQRFLNLVNSLPELTTTVLASSKFSMSDPKTLPVPANTIVNVLEFHETYKCPIGTTPSVPDGPHELPLRQLYNHLMDLRTFMRSYSKEDVRCQRMALNIEELAEQCKAFADRDVKSVLDAGADKSYINAGDMIVCGLADVFYEAEDRVHMSNMSKTDENGNPIYDASGKVVKGPNYKPVDLSDLVDGSWLSSQSDEQS